jgi:threonine/homoserine/homoserine lactone efflux protein
MPDLLPLAAYTAVMSITPGPNNVMLTASGVNFGFRRTLPQVLGIGAGVAVQVYLMCVGLGSLFNALPWLQALLKWGGAAYLCYLAWRIAQAGEVGQADSARPMSAWQGLTFQFINPKAWVMAITAAGLFLPPGEAAWFAGLVIVLIFVLVNLPCISVWTLFGVALARLLTDARNRRWLNGAMALLLVATAVYGVLDSHGMPADTGSNHLSQAPAAQIHTHAHA